MPSLTQTITKGSKLHRMVLTAIRARVRASENSQARQAFMKKWQDAEDRTLGYLPERGVDALRRVEREGGKPQYTTIQIPYSAAVLLASHTYWTTVFLSRNPVIQLQGLHGEGEMQVLATEAFMNYQTTIGEHISVYHTWLQDAGKYGQGIVTGYWDKEEITVSEIVMQPAPSIGGISFGPSKKVKQTRRLTGYEGNRLVNIRPLDFFHDPRVTLGNFQKGEFCGYRTTLAWSQIAKGVRDKTFIDVTALGKQKLDDLGDRQSSSTTQVSNSLYLPDNSAFGRSYIDGKLAGKSLNCIEMYIDLVPADWGLGASTVNEKYVFIVDDRFEYVLAARPLGCYHNKFPFGVLQIDASGYSVYNEGIPDTTKDIQNTIDWLINSHFYNVRKTLNNEFIVDPSRIEMRDLKNPLPGGLIRAKMAAYGTDMRTAIHQVQTQDLTRSHMADIEMMMSMGERVTGVNDTVMGIASSSSRRSATEIRSSNTFSVNRLKTISEYFSASGWAPLSKMLVSNSQQYYDSEKKMRLAGKHASLLAGEGFINVTPETIAGFYDFIPVDGSLPVDQFAQANLWRTLIGEMRQIPPLMAQYDIAKIFGYVAQLSGLKNIEQFKIQVVPDGVLQMQAQAGNVVPLGGGGGAVGGSTSAPIAGQAGPTQ